MKKTIHGIERRETKEGRKASSPASKISSGRDLRIDSLRGVLLVVMTLVHFPSYLSGFFRQALGYVSAAEGFFFLSAYLFSFVHAGKAVNLKDIYAIGLRRAWVIYRYYVGIVLTQFALITTYILVFSQGRSAGRDLFRQASSGILRELLFIHQPRLINILPTYFAFVLISPMVLYAFSRNWTAWVFAISAGLWVLGQHVNPMACLASLAPGSEPGYFNWIAFQLLWVGGMYVGFSNSRGEDFPWARNRIVVVTSLALAAVLFFSRHGMLHLFFDAQKASDRPNFGWLTLLNFILLAVLVCSLFRHLPKNRGLPFFGFIGRYSLQVFSFHLFLFFLLIPLPSLNMGRFREDILALIALLAVASLYLPALIQSRLDEKK